MKKSFALSSATALVAVLALAATGVAWAEGMDKGMSEKSESTSTTLTTEEQSTFSQLDTNKDGKISQEEAKNNADLTDKFDSVDSNHDKVLDEGEFARFEADTE